MALSYQQVKENFLSGRFKDCKSYFKKHGYYVESAYCNIILDKLKEAKQDFEKAAEYDCRAHWGILLLQMIEGNISFRPSYFEVRNFLEIDLNILITYCKGDYVEKIIRYADFLAFYNAESYKFIGRVLWANNFIPQAMFFFDIAKDKLYNDPELHYLLAYIFHSQNEIEKCQYELNTCLNILPLYAPAKNLLSRLAKV